MNRAKAIQLFGVHYRTQYATTGYVILECLGQPDPAVPNSEFATLTDAESKIREKAEFFRREAEEARPGDFIMPVTEPTAALSYLPEGLLISPLAEQKHPVYVVTRDENDRPCLNEVLLVPYRRDEDMTPFLYRGLTAKGQSFYFFHPEKDPLAIQACDQPGHPETSAHVEVFTSANAAKERMTRLDWQFADRAAPGENGATTPVRPIQATGATASAANLTIS